MKELLKQLNELAAELTEESCRLNYGGCCVLATMMYEKLKPIFGRKVRIEFWVTHDGWTERDPEQVRINLRDWKNNSANHTNSSLSDSVGVSCNHAYVVFNFEGTKYYFDTDVGAVEYNEIMNTIHDEYGLGLAVRMNYPVAKTMASTGVGWNSTFNRGLIPVLQEHINQKQLTK